MSGSSRRVAQGRLAAAITLFSAAALIGSGCGYTSTIGPRNLAGGPKSDSARKLAIVALRNDSPEPWLDRVVTDALRREFGLRAGFELINDPRKADIVLRGRILPLSITSDTFSAFVAALEYSVTLALELELLRSDGQIVRLDPGVLSGNEVFLASPDIEVTRSNRLEALRRLSDLLAGRVADSLEFISRPLVAPEEVGG